MEGYIYESIKEFLEVLREKWEVLIPPLVLLFLSKFVFMSNRRYYDRIGILYLSLFLSGLWIGFNITEINLLTAFLIGFSCIIPGTLLLVYRGYDAKLSFVAALVNASLLTLSYYYAVHLYSKGETIYHLIGQAIFWGIFFYSLKKDEEEKMKEEERKERYRRVLTSSYESPLILPPSVGVVRKYSEEERQKELYWLIMQDIIDKQVDNETFYAIERIKDPKLKEKLLKEAYEVKIEIEKEKAYEEGEMDGYMSGYSSGYSSGFASGYAAGSDS